MANISISQLPAFVGGNADATDLLVMVDVSDLSASPQGTTKRMTNAQVLAGAATKLQTARTINGVAFDGTANITTPAAAGTLTGATLAANVLNSSLTSVGTLGTLTVSGNINGTLNGNAATTTKLQTARLINGVAFDGTADITLPAGAAAAGTLTGVTLAANVVNSSLTSVGTLAAGIWAATPVAPTFGGTGLNAYAVGDLLYGNAVNTLARLAVGTANQVLTLVGGVPTWQTPTGGAVSAANVTSGTFPGSYTFANGLTSNGPVIAQYVTATGGGNITLGDKASALRLLRLDANTVGAFTDTDGYANLKANVIDAQSQVTIAGRAALAGSAAYTQLFSPDGAALLQIGGSDPGTYIDNGTTYIRARGGSSTYATFGASGVTATGSITANGGLLVPSFSQVLAANDGASTLTKYLNLANNGASTFIGIEGASGGGVFSTGSPYALTIGQLVAKNIEFFTNNAKRVTVDSNGAVIIGADPGGTELLRVWTGGAKIFNLGQNGNLGFFGMAPTTKRTVAGAKGSNAALGSLLTALAFYGLISDTTTA